MKPYIRNSNKEKFDVINFRIIQLPNKEYTIQTQRQFMFGKIKIWTDISEFSTNSIFTSSSLIEAENNIKWWREYYEDLAEERITSKKTISTLEVRKRETHPEHFV